MINPVAVNHFCNISLCRDCYYSLSKSSTRSWTFHACHSIFMYHLGHLLNRGSVLPVPWLLHWQNRCSSYCFPLCRVVGRLCTRFSWIRERSIRGTSESCFETSFFWDQDTKWASPHVTAFREFQSRNFHYQDLRSRIRTNTPGGFCAPR